jgi:hypothetical protein
MIKEPIIINAHGAVSIFRRLNNAEGYLEAIDVENNEYVGFDAEDRILDLLIEKRQRKFFRIFNATVETVKISSGENIPSGPDNLKEILYHVLRDQPDITLDLELPELLDKAIRKSGYTSDYP